MNARLSQRPLTSLRGNIVPVASPAASLQVAADTGAKRILRPMAAPDTNPAQRPSGDVPA